MASPTSVVVEGEDPTPLTLSEWKPLPASAKSLRTSNPIRAIVDEILTTSRNDSSTKPFLSLALGDPTEHIPPCPAALRAIHATLDDPHPANGYAPAVGTLEARQAIAEYHGTTPDQVIVANGCSGALELVLTALLDDDSILLVPQPGFPLYRVIAESHGARVLGYRTWKDIRQLHGKYGSRIRGLVVNNPGNPTGIVYSREQLEEVVDLCEDLRLPIIADEIYGDLTFGDAEFVPLATLRRDVPVITVSGIGKQYLLPGWRMGWAVFHDNAYGSLREVRLGAMRLSQVILGASRLAQAAVPALLNPHDPEIAAWKANLRATLEMQAAVLVSSLQDTPGIDVSPPQGAMYCMVHIHTSDFDEAIQSGVDFCKLLLEEENVLCLPGSCFGDNDMVRLVICLPPHILEEASRRIHSFCTRHLE